ncbi:hypothetical protein V8C86DRAFT_769554 [Haematococcus lacustris]
MLPRDQLNPGGDSWQVLSACGARKQHCQLISVAQATADLQPRALCDGPVESTTQRQQPRQPADISQFLVAAPVWELKQMRRLCHLTSLTYKMHLVTPRALRRKHALDLVTTSWACEVRTYEPSKTAIEIASEGDGMAMSMSEASALYIPGDPSNPAPPPLPPRPLPWVSKSQRQRMARVAACLPPRCILPPPVLTVVGPSPCRCSRQTPPAPAGQIPQQQTQVRPGRGSLGVGNPLVRWWLRW